MKIVSSLVLATLAIAVLAADHADASQVHGHAAAKAAQHVPLKQRLAENRDKAHAKVPAHPEAKHVSAKTHADKNPEAKKAVVSVKHETKKAVAVKVEAKKAEPAKQHMPVKKPEAKKPVAKKVGHKAVAKKAAEANKPVAKKAVLKKALPIAANKLPKHFASDLNEEDGEGDVLGDPFVGATFGWDDEMPVTTPPTTSDEDSGSGSGSGGSGDWDGSDSGEGSSSDDGSLPADETSHGHEESWGLFDSPDSGSGSGSMGEEPFGDTQGFNDDDLPPVSGSEGPGSEESGDDEPLGTTQSFNDDGTFGDLGDFGKNGAADTRTILKKVEAIKTVVLKMVEQMPKPKAKAAAHEAEAKKHVETKKKEDKVAKPAAPTKDAKKDVAKPKKNTKAKNEAKKNTADKSKKVQQQQQQHKEELQQKEAGAELASRLIQPSDSSSFDLGNSKALLLVGSIVGAVVGVLAVLLGVVHLRRLQSDSGFEPSTLAAELPEPQTGRDEPFDDTGVLSSDDELASSGVDLEEALNNDGGEHEAHEEQEGAFANDVHIVV